MYIDIDRHYMLINMLTGNLCYLYLQRCFSTNIRPMSRHLLPLRPAYTTCVTSTPPLTIYVTTPLSVTYVKHTSYVTTPLPLTSSNLRHDQESE